MTNQAKIDKIMFSLVVQGVFRMLYHGCDGARCWGVSEQRGVGPVLEDFILQHSDAWGLYFDTRTTRLAEGLFCVELVITRAFRT